MTKPDSVSEPQLERKGARLQANGGRFLLLGIILAVPGIVLIILGSGWVFALGLALLALGLVPGAVAVALLLSGAVARWTARERPFA